MTDEEERMILPHFTVLILGEILWDVFGAEAKIGGAPYNFGAHLSRLGESAALVTAVGRDGLGIRPWGWPKGRACRPTWSGVPPCPPAAAG